MIKSAIQLKAKVRNKSHGNDKTAKTLIRLFFMERFLERVSLSRYKEQFILKGGMLVSSLLGIDLRSTMDIDTTVKALPLTNEAIERIITEISEIFLEDRVSFRITAVDTIMEEFEYPGVRVHMEGMLEKLRQPIKLDISTDDAITPRAVEYQYQLIFENRNISLNTYNIETLLAEKTQTIINRGTANTRMRDFYDLYEIAKKKEISLDTYKEAFYATCKKRGTEFSDERIRRELKKIALSKEMERLWDNFKTKNYFAEDIGYGDVVQLVSQMIIRIIE